MSKNEKGWVCDYCEQVIPFPAPRGGPIDYDQIPLYRTQRSHAYPKTVICPDCRDSKCYRDVIRLCYPIYEEIRSLHLQSKEGPI